MIEIKPPKWSTWVLGLFIRKKYLEEVQGDLEEVFYDDLSFYSSGKAKRLYNLGVLQLFRLSLLKNLKWIYQIGLINIIMRNFRIAFRNLLKFKTHSAINLLGLSLGLAIGGLIMLYVLDELSFDTFHAKSDRIYKVVTTTEDGGMETVAHPIGYHLRNDFPEVESVVYVRNVPSSFKLFHKDERFSHDILYAGNEFFDIFSFNLIKGNPNSALESPNSVVITQSIENTYFDGDALGKTLILQDSLEFSIEGVLEDVPSNSHIQFEILISFSTFPKHRYFSYTDGWGNFDVRNYILLEEGTDIGSFATKANGLYDEHVGEWLAEMGMKMSVDLVPLANVYLEERFGNGVGPDGSMKRVRTVFIIAIFLILLACINYVNLSTARSTYRSKEVGMKKIVGAARTSIIGQFMTESFVLTCLSFLFSVLIIIAILPFFNQLMDKSYHFGSFMTAPFLAGSAILILLVTTFSGFYPAWVISKFMPLQALSGKLSTNNKGLNLRKTLITFQFFISSGLVLSTLLVIHQIRFMRTQELGFDKEQIIVISASNIPMNSARQVLKNELKRLPGVQKVSHTNALPGRPGWQGQWAYPEKFSDQHVDTEYMAIDEDYLETLGLELLAGRNFELERTSELKNGLIINETCVEAMGWSSPEEAVGRSIVSPSSQPAGTVIGVVKDYHGLGLQSTIWPKAMDYTGHEFGRYYAIRYDAAQTYDLIKGIEKTWDVIYGSYPLDYFFLDQDFDRQYNEENQLAQVLSIFAVVVILVSAIGLLGLISFIALSRTKEVGIRKTLGASIGQIVYILSKEFVILVLLGNLLSIPLIWIYGNEWLNDFAYHTSINPIIFLITVMVTAFIAFLTISFQTYKTARMNPVNSLRYE